VDEIILRQIESDNSMGNAVHFRSNGLRVYAEAISLMRLLFTAYRNDAEMKRISVNAFIPRIEQILHTCELVCQIPVIEGTKPGNAGMSPLPYDLHLFPKENSTANSFEEIFVEVLRTCFVISDRDTHEIMHGEAIRIAMKVFNMIQNMPNEINMPDADHTAIYIAIMKCVRIVVCREGERTPVLTRVYKGAIRDPKCNDKLCAEFLEKLIPPSLIDKIQSEALSKR